MECGATLIWSLLSLLGLLVSVYHRWRSAWLTLVVVAFSFMLLGCLLSIVACLSDVFPSPTRDLAPWAEGFRCFAFGILVIGLAGSLGHLGRKVNRLEDSLYALGHGARADVPDDALRSWKERHERSHDIQQ